MPTATPILTVFATSARGLTVPAGTPCTRFRDRVSRCLTVATVACLATAPLFHRTKSPSPAHPVPTAAPVSVTADIARRLAPAVATPGSVADGVLWAGLQ